MKITVSCSKQDGWGTHAVTLQSRTVEDPVLHTTLVGLRSALIGEAPDADFVLTLDSVVSSPIAERFDTNGLVQVAWFRPHDVEEICAFDRRITARYTEFCSSIGEHYVGTFECAQLGGDVVAEVAWFDQHDFDEVDAVQSAVELPADVDAIITECRSMQRTDAPKYALDLTPHPAQ